MAQAMPTPGDGRIPARAPVLLALVLPLFLQACGGGARIPPAAESAPSGLAAKNIILFVGDGMGPEHVRAAGMYRSGPGGTLSFEAFPFRAKVATSDADGGVTDSAAAATAMATGIKVHGGVVSVARPGDGAPLRTVLEICKAAGKSTGLVTTATIPDATPAAFGAHRASRADHAGICDDYLVRSRPNVLFGGGRFLTAARAKAAGYAVVRNRAELVALETESRDRVAGLFGTDNLPYEADGAEGLPHLPETTEIALRILDNDPDGLFLMVEGGRIDHASHANDIARAVVETIAFSDAVAVAAEWAATHGDTLIVVTADHETGGLRLPGASGAGVVPEASWRGRRHTAAKVPVYARGPGADRVPGMRENTDIFRIMFR